MCISEHGAASTVYCLRTVSNSNPALSNLEFNMVLHDYIVDLVN